MTDPKDYTRRSWFATLALIAVLTAISLIPPRSVGGVRLRRANILSDLISFDDPATQAGGLTDATFDVEEFAVDLDQVARQVAQQPVHTVETRYIWQAGEVPVRTRTTPYPAPARKAYAPIEDFDTTGASRMQALYRKWLVYGTPVRIAFLGDSFIEGDILTADLRERLQTAFGGHGPGFAPAASPHTGFRRTVKTLSRGWTPYNIMQRKSTPKPLAGSYTVSGWVCRPTAGASTRWECNGVREGLDSCSSAGLLFVSRTDSRVELTLNDTQRRTFEIEGGEPMRRIEVRGPIRSVSMKVLAGTEGFIGYGAQLGGVQGVVVDNYSVRSNNGQAMFWTDAVLNAQLDQLAGGYDLVVLQYGLNILQEGIRNYTKYSEQIENMIAYVRRCFPSAAVLVMGVSDRSVRDTQSGAFRPMDSAPFMTDFQRRAARNQGAAFWSTFDAMQAMGGMARFVENGWAGKDYTHINYAGGRQIADALYDALYEGVYALQQQELSRQKRREELHRILSSDLEEHLLRDSLRPLSLHR